MEKNQNDKRNQESGSKSLLEKFEDGTKKKETNPANPTAKQDHRQDSNQDNNQQKESVPAATSNQSKSNSNDQDSEEGEENSTETETSEKSDNQNAKKARF